MPLQKQNVVFPMAKGIDTKSDPKQLVTGTMETLQNAVFTSTNQFQTRNGYQELANISNPHGIGVLNNELAAFGNNTVYRYAPGEGDFVTAKSFVSSGGTAVNFQGMQIDTFPSISEPYSWDVSDIAYHTSGLYGVASVSANGIAGLYQASFTIMDSESKSVLFLGSIAVNVRTAPKVFALGGYFIILFYESTSIKYIAVPVNTTGTTSLYSSAVTIASTMNTATNQTFDACVLGNFLYVVWGINGNGFGYATIDVSITVRTSTFPLTDQVSAAISVTADETLEQLSVAYYNGSAVKYLQTDLLFTQVLAPVIVETIASIITIAQIIDNNTGYIFYERAGSSPGTNLFFNNYIRRAAIASGVCGTPADYIRSVGIVSKPFKVTLDGTDVTCIMCGYTGAQPAAPSGTVFILNDSSVVIGKLAPGNCQGISTWAQATTTLKSCLTEVCQIDDTNFASVFQTANFTFTLEGNQASDSTTLAQYVPYICEFNFDSTLNYQTASAANNLHTVGGTLMMYDGSYFVEHGFNIIAEAPTAAVQSHAGADNFAAGTYSYIIVYEWMDAKGAVHRSVPSAPYDVVVASAQTQIALTIPTLRLTQKAIVYLSVFRNTLASPSEFQRVLAYPGAATLSGSTALNSITSDSITFKDEVPDATLDSHQFIYTFDGTVPNYAVPSPKFVAPYRNRLIVLPRETPNILWISKTIVNDTPPVPVEFSKAFTIEVNTIGGDINAFMQMDEKGVIFKDASIYYFVGDGPDNTGSTNDISVPSQVASDVGCVNQRSLVLTPNGIIFKSFKGLYLLDRSLQVSYIGAQVEAYNDSNILSALFVPNTTQARFMLDTGEILVYDYFVGQWSVFTNLPGVDAVIYNNLYTFMNTDGRTLQETIGEYSDAGSFISMKLKTGWLSFAGIQGFQRIFKMLLLGTYKSAHQLQVKFAFDFNPNPFQTVLFSPTDVFAQTTYGEDTPYGDSDTYGGEFPLEQFTLYPEIQRCESMQVTIEAIQQDNVLGASFAISSLGFEVGVEGGLQRQGATKKFG